MVDLDDGLGRKKHQVDLQTEKYPETLKKSTSPINREIPISSENHRFSRSFLQTEKYPETLKKSTSLINREIPKSKKYPYPPRTIDLAGLFFKQRNTQKL
jgi:hypothetical protein